MIGIRVLATVAWFIIWMDINYILQSTVLKIGRKVKQIWKILQDLFIYNGNKRKESRKLETLGMIFLDRNDAVREMFFLRQHFAFVSW